jgi:hypothetical protein
MGTGLPVRIDILWYRQGAVKIQVATNACTQISVNTKGENRGNSTP